MGGLCSRSSTTESTLGGGVPNAGGHVDHESMGHQPQGFSSKTVGDLNPPFFGEIMDKRLQEPVSFSERNASEYGNNNLVDVEPGEQQLGRALSYKSRSTKSKSAAAAKMGTAKVSEMSFLLGRAGTVGLGKAVEVLDTLGSSMTNLNLNSGFASGVTTKGNKIAILAFEVANTIVKGSNLLQSLSEENIKHLKEVVLPSEGVQFLISKDIDELLRIAAADKREELKVFSREVVRFGNRCKDPQWHHLERYFDKLGYELVPQRQSKEEAEAVMQHLMTFVQYTAELYHELHALDRFEQDYRRKLQEEENSNAVQKGDSLAILRAELKSQKKHVKSLKKKSLWSKNLEEVMEKLVDTVHFLHVEIHDAFGNADGDKPVKGSLNDHQRLGSAGLALHYANIISQIDTLVSRSSSVPPNTRDTLYQGLPPSIKSALRFKLLSFQVKEELTVPQIKAEMDRTLQWLVPIATNTTKAHHGFGWVGEWANTG
ncbi:protein PSK SIMULATOR 1-like isoform X2 [Magnolia sinica]|nr:protein PSK SIMULATOR 1-like isoform X2 [Magnolia sinica]